MIWFVIASLVLKWGFFMYLCSSQKPNQFMSNHVPSLKGKVAELLKEVETLKELAHTRLHELRDKAESLKTLHADYALLEEKYYTQSDNYTELNKMHNDLIESHNKVTAENYALKAENERTNRHINLAENQLHKEQQPLVVNHYHNCTINK